MKTIEFSVQTIKGKENYSVKHSPKLGAILQRTDENFASLLLRTIQTLSECNSSREPVEVRLSEDFPTPYKEWIRTSFTHYAGHKGVAVLYPNAKGKSERLRTWEPD